MRIKLQHPRLPGVDNGFDGDRFYFEIQADGNHETLATSEIYNSKDDALHAIELIAGGTIILSNAGGVIGLAHRDHLDVHIDDETADD